MRGFAGLAEDAHALVDCLAEQMSVRDMPDPCFLGVLPGEIVPLDYCNGCDSGMGWVRIAEVGPDQDEAVVTGCSVVPIRATVEMGFVQAHAVIRPDGEPATVDEQADSFDQQMTAAAAMYAALTCCSLPSGAKVSNIAYVPIGPEGNCVGGSFSATIEVI